MPKSEHGDVPYTEETMVSLRNQIDAWYENLPRSGTQLLVHPYLEVNFRLLLVRLYAPCKRVPFTPLPMMPVLRKSAFTVIEMYGKDRDGRQDRIAQNHITLFHITTCCVALVYVLTANEGSDSNFRLVSWRRKAVEQVEAAQKYLDSFCQASVYSPVIPAAFRKYSAPLVDKLRHATNDTPANIGWAPIRLQHSQQPEYQPQQRPYTTSSLQQQQQQLMQPTQSSQISQPARPSQLSLPSQTQLSQHSLTQTLLPQPTSLSDTPHPDITNYTGLTMANSSNTVDGQQFTLPWNTMDTTVTLDGMDFLSNPADMDDLLTTLGLGSFAL
jgi:hypothetical protein